MHHNAKLLLAFSLVSTAPTLGCVASDEESRASDELITDASSVPLAQVRITMDGPSEVAIDPSKYRDVCLEKYDLTGNNHLDQPLRVFRDYTKQLHIIASNNLNLQFTATDFSFADLHQHCRPVIDDHKELFSLDMPKPEEFMSREWLLSTFTPDGKTVYGYIHNELHGEKYAPLRPMCNSSGETCWYASITKYVSTDGGMHFDPLVLPGDRTHLLMASVHKYHPLQEQPDGTLVATGKAGIAGHTNVFRGADGAYYMFANRVELTDTVQQPGTCLLRSADLTHWKSWQGPGQGYADNLVDPYSSTTDPQTRTCAVVSTRRFFSVTYHPGLKAYISIVPLEAADGTHGFGYELSRDLVTWTEPVYLRDQISADAGVLVDQQSSSRNFDTTGDHPHLYFGAFCGPDTSTGAHCVRRQPMKISISSR